MCRSAKRIGDRLPAVESERGREAAVDLGNQHATRWHPSAVKRGQRVQAPRVAVRREAEGDLGLNVLTRSHNQQTIVDGW
jgi:hypothetical protein